MIKSKYPELEINHFLLSGNLNQEAYFKAANKAKPLIKKLLECNHFKYYKNVDFDITNLMEIIYYASLSEFYYLIIDFCTVEYINLFLFYQNDLFEARDISTAFYFLSKDSNHEIAKNNQKYNIAGDFIESNLTAKYKAFDSFKVEEYCYKIFENCS